MKKMHRSDKMSKQTKGESHKVAQFQGEGDVKKHPKAKTYNKKAMQPMKGRKKS